jgi:uncharacterized surface protein with fasciclin (FAS1) repeats
MNNTSEIRSTNLVDAAASQGTLNTFGQTVAAAGLTDFFKGLGPYTVFAPTDAAFAKLPAGRLDEWLKPENKGQLISILKYHVSPGRVTGEEIGKLNETTTVNGQAAQIKKAGDAITIDNANITTADVAASNGVIHVIDDVLMPTKH